MKPKEVNEFQNESEKKSYNLLKSLDETYTVIYEPSIGKKRKYTPDFIVLSKQYGLIILDTKYVKLSNIKETNLQTITKTNGTRIQNFCKTIKTYMYSVNNQLVNELNNIPLIVHPKDSYLSGKLTFPYSGGLLLFIEEDDYTHSEIAEILSLNNEDFFIINSDENLEDFIKQLNRPIFKSKLTDEMKSIILSKVYLNSDVNVNQLFEILTANENKLNSLFYEELTGSHFDKSKQLKNNIVEYVKYATSSLGIVNSNLGLGYDIEIDKLLEKKDDIVNEKFTVAVFGYFSSGKSTFLNVLMKTDKLPMDQDRLTASFTRLKHCNSENDYNHGDLKVIYKSKLDIEFSYKESIEKLPFSDEELKKYINFNELQTFKDELKITLDSIKLIKYSGNERDDIKNRKKTLKYIMERDIPYDSVVKISSGDEVNKYIIDDSIAYGISEVVYYLNNDLLKDIEIVDTPGFGSENTMDTYKTQEFIKEANALILLTDAKTPMSDDDEIKFLDIYSELNKNNDNTTNSDNLFIIANKIDESSKYTEKVVNIIKERIEDHFEDGLIVDNDKIFTMSAKYHYEVMTKGTSNIVSENINKNDMNTFIKKYFSFLTKNKDKELLSNSLKKIQTITFGIESDFKKNLQKKDDNIQKINEDIQRFNKNRENIKEKYNLIYRSFSDIPEKLKRFITVELNKQHLSLKGSENNRFPEDEIDKFFSEQGVFSKDTLKEKRKIIKKSWDDAVLKTAEEFSNYLKHELNLNSDRATKENSKDFYEKFSIEIFQVIQKRTSNEMKNLIEKDIKLIDQFIEDYSKKIENEYDITGLILKSEIEYNNNLHNLEIEFEKGFLNTIIDFILIGYYVTAHDYAKQMVTFWNKEADDKESTYNLILNNIHNENENIINDILEKAMQSNDDIVNSIGVKLNAKKKTFDSRQNNLKEYTQKMEKAKSIFLKIDSKKDVINKQVNDLYGHL